VLQTRSKALDYLDALILRLVPGTDNWFRNHFPVILETNKSHYFNELIFNDLNMPQMSIPTLEYGVAIEGASGPYNLFTE
jgi:hypothetical protein